MNEKSSQLSLKLSQPQRKALAEVVSAWAKRLML